MKKRVLCYGDSNTWGHIPGGKGRYPESVRWTGVCQQELGDDFVIIEDGINGRTTIFDQPFSEYLNGIKGLGYSLLSQAPLDIIVMFLGTNDITFNNIERVQYGIDEIIRTCINANYIYRSEGPIFLNTPKVLLLIPMPFDPVVDKIPGSAKNRYFESTKFKEYFLPVADKYGIGCLDTSDIADVSRIDGVHLTAVGHERIGKAVAEMIKTLLSNDL